MITANKRRILMSGSVIIGLVAVLGLTGCKVGGESAAPDNIIQPSVPGSNGNSNGNGGENGNGSGDYPPSLLFEHAGFEFCCGGYDTYGQHGFEAAGDFLKLDGGEWAEGINGRIGERVFASFGNGYRDENADNTEWVGWEATGTLTTPTFEIPAQYINFLVGGGTNPYGHERATAIALYVGGEVVRDATGNGVENSLSPVTWDVADYVGQEAYIRIVDLHNDDGSDDVLPFILVDHIEASSEAATTPIVSGAGGEAELVFTDSPETEGHELFSVHFSDQHIAGFEFCCGGFNTYGNHGFGVSGDVLLLDGGEWAEGIHGSVGERAFISYGRHHDGGFIQPDSEFTGRLQSPEFTISRNFINFLAGGGTNHFDGPNATAIVLRINGQVVRQATGNDSDSLSWVTWDVSGFIGQRGVIEIIDEHDASEADGSLPFIMADEFRQADKAAVEPATDSRVSDNPVAMPSSRLRMGDPNPYYEDGIFYLFYLHDAGRHPWYLATTENLLDYSNPVEVLPVGPEPDDQDNWTGSGSVVELDGTYYMFYTGHNQNITPVEAVMVATSDDGMETWTKQPEMTFTGSDGYSDYDFRDPWVFWHETENEYWLLITTRYADEAVIGLYTSDDLLAWEAQPPLYSEASPLNLEVPEMLFIGGDEYLIYSDQRDESRQVRQLVRNGAWEYPDYDALDGRAFYAARTAGPEDEKILFGWVPHKYGLSNTGKHRWGGDLVAHQIERSSDGSLAVRLPDRLINQLTDSVSPDVVTEKGDVSEAGETIVLGVDSAFLMAPATSMTRISAELSGYPDGAPFGVYFFNEETRVSAYVEFDSSQDDKVSFFFSGDKANPESPSVSVPLAGTGSVDVEILLDPVLEYGVVYINDYRALTFRFYELSEYGVGFYSEEGVTVTNLNRFE